MMDEEKHFIIQDLDETHLLVSADSVDMIKEQLEEEVRLSCRTSARLRDASQLEKNSFQIEI